jgi:hydrogenase 3 maturation protease
MFKPCWPARLARMTKGARVAVVGIGHELRGDDAAGVAIVRALETAARNDECLLVIDAGPAPENQIGPLLRFEPDVILFVDAAQMGEASGTVRWVSWHETDGLGASTHTLSPQVLARFLVHELGCEVLLLGIQPASCAVGARLSPAVAEAVHSTVQVLLNVLSRDRSRSPARHALGKGSRHREALRKGDSAIREAGTVARPMDVA